MAGYPCNLYDRTIEEIKSSFTSTTTTAPAQKATQAPDLERRVIQKAHKIQYDLACFCKSVL